MALVVQFDGGFDQLPAIFLGLVEQVGRDLFVVNFAPRPSSSQTTAFMRRGR